jgi:cobalt/nickel transport system permease protein
VAGGIAGYAAINLSALFTALELGIQPLIAHNASGQPLYAPFPLSVAVPAMLFGHLLFFGFVEALVTASIILYFQRSDISMLTLLQVPSTRQPSDNPGAEAVQPELKLKANDSCSP